MKHLREYKSAWLIKAKTLIRPTINAIVTLLDRLVPDKPRRVIFGADGGHRFADNPRRLFEHMVRSGEWDPYWVTKSRHALNEINALYPGRGLWWLSLRTLLIGLQSPLRVISQSRADILPIGFSNRKRIIHLTHGTPFKTMGLATPTANPAYIARENSTFLHMIACSDYAAGLWREAYGYPANDILTLGMPRNDLLFESDAALIDKHPFLKAKLILYAPTYRDWAPLDRLLPVGQAGLGRLIALLEAHDAYLLIRPHYFEMQSADEAIARAGSERIINAGATLFPDINPILRHTDILVTDYSSIYLDFLLLDRPVIFLPADLDRYIAERGLMLDYDSFTAGTKALDEEAFLDALALELEGRDPFAPARAKMAELFHRFHDGNSSARITRHLERIAG
ncbi:hypothetical protein CLG96_09405 [Sphingomonas oleivorans]|uniref:CDP-glycerol glycerophosphotransferase n=1 Tax=Sphingomonas oleivorans TaxID=1735121 RepID=A0A2T5FYN6_9SPHN|nr:CDP-glycerol glycerophosphotransferase family protein [Sphingomonas oleivorans]PTQ11625.1 hypothetical protein CLG96_09405 [Sphingomonas oleivorans]